ncbi:hypothetical protein C8R46DRAFT_1042774 [Mycena filopes]|nr:hypothetical protein C8R46DRAFT_1042774 [Mycena filopes]
MAAERPEPHQLGKKRDGKSKEEQRIDFAPVKRSDGIRLVRSLARPPRQTSFRPSVHSDRKLGFKDGPRYFLPCRLRREHGRFPHVIELPSPVDAQGTSEDQSIIGQRAASMTRFCVHWWDRAVSYGMEHAVTMGLHAARSTNTAVEGRDRDVHSAEVNSRAPHLTQLELARRTRRRTTPEMHMQSRRNQRASSRCTLRESAEFDARPGLTRLPTVPVYRLVCCHSGAPKSLQLRCFGLLLAYSTEYSGCIEEHRMWVRGALGSSDDAQQRWASRSRSTKETRDPEDLVSKPPSIGERRRSERGATTESDWAAKAEGLFACVRHGVRWRLLPRSFHPFRPLSASPFATTIPQSTDSPQAAKSNWARIPCGEVGLTVRCARLRDLNCAQRQPSPGPLVRKLHVPLVPLLLGLLSTGVGSLRENATPRAQRSGDCKCKSGCVKAAGSSSASRLHRAQECLRRSGFRAWRHAVVQALAQRAGRKTHGVLYERSGDAGRAHERHHARPSHARFDTSHSTSSAPEETMPGPCRCSHPVGVAPATTSMAPRAPALCTRSPEAASNGPAPPVWAIAQSQRNRCTPQDSWCSILQCAPKKPANQVTGLASRARAWGFQEDSQGLDLRFLGTNKTHARLMPSSRAEARPTTNVAGQAGSTSESGGGCACTRSPFMQVVLAPRHPPAASTPFAYMVPRVPSKERWYCMTSSPWRGRTRRDDAGVHHWHEAQKAQNSLRRKSHAAATYVALAFSTRHPLVVPQLPVRSMANVARIETTTTGPPARGAEAALVPICTHLDVTCIERRRRCGRSRRNATPNKLARSIQLVGRDRARACDLEGRGGSRSRMGTPAAAVTRVALTRNEELARGQRTTSSAARTPRARSRNADAEGRSPREERGTGLVCPEVENGAARDEMSISACVLAEDYLSRAYSRHAAATQVALAMDANVTLCAETVARKRYPVVVVLWLVARKRAPQRLLFNPMLQIAKAAEPRSHLHRANQRSGNRPGASPPHRAQEHAVHTGGSANSVHQEISALRGMQLLNAGGSMFTTLPVGRQQPHTHSHVTRDRPHALSRCAKLRLLDAHGAKGRGAQHRECGDMSLAPIDGSVPADREELLSASAERLGWDGSNDGFDQTSRMQRIVRADHEEEEERRQHNAVLGFRVDSSSGAARVRALRELGREVTSAEERARSAFGISGATSRVDKCWRSTISRGKRRGIFNAQRVQLQEEPFWNQDHKETGSPPERQTHRVYALIELGVPGLLNFPYGAWQRPEQPWMALESLGSSRKGAQHSVGLYLRQRYRLLSIRGNDRHPGAMRCGLAVAPGVGPHGDEEDVQPPWRSSPRQRRGRRGPRARTVEVGDGVWRGPGAAVEALKGPRRWDMLLSTRRQITTSSHQSFSGRCGKEQEEGGGGMVPDQGNE